MARAARTGKPDRCCVALQELADVGPAVKQGKQGLKGEHRGMIDQEVAVGCSLDLDVATTTLRGSGDKCWDYVLCAEMDTLAVEVHPCGGGSVDEMRGKRDWALQFLSQRGVTVRWWFWLVPKNASFSFRRGGREEKLLVAARIGMPRRVLTKKDLRGPG